ncbi:hypothetical protein [Actinomadura sp. DC4]|uniref:hypothetical protein n=1 Tax=Actinomadura sp. DC4 TaxID=3055069 RepID=UPI0025AFDC3C|nr:hypothetical protein [Actinomadura sp. DC4]MDN3351668.1 hypothetical protein [Actinomadura sp. DC4]
MLKRIAAVLALAGTALISSSFPPARASTGHAVLIGVPGLRWSDVSPSATPNLWRLAGGSGIGLLSVRAVGTLTCPADAWATVSAGARSAAGPFCEKPLTVTPYGPGAVVGEVARLRRMNAGFGPVGLLGGAVHRAGGCTAAVGPGAALAAADSGGRVDVYAPSDPASALARCPVTVVDAGSVLGGGGPRLAAVRRADAMIGSVLARAPSSDVVVAGVADDGAVHLRPVLATGAAGRYLGSDSTRRSDMVILPDLTATLLRSAGIPAPEGMVGTPLLPSAVRPARLSSAVADLTSQDVAAQTHRRLLPRFFAGFVVSQVLLYAAAALALRLRWAPGHRRRILSATRLTALAAAAVPVSTYLVNVLPWWHTASPLAWLVAGVAAFDASVVAVAVAGPWRRDILGPGTVIAAVTAAVLGLDLVTGSDLQLNSLMGYSPLVGGRYYGMGNIAFAVLATSSLLAAAGVAQWLEPRRGRRAAVAAVLALTLTAALLDSWTAWGSDFGGLIAFVPGLATTALLVAGRRVSFLRLQLLRATGMALVLGMAWIDYLRPPSRRTHMGRFFGQLVEGDSLPWLERKFTAMTHTFGNMTLMPVVVSAFLFVLLVLHRPGRARAGGLELAYARAPMLRAGLSGAFVTALVGGAVNDSGVAVPALALAVAVPLALAATVVALQARDTAAAAAPATAPGAPRPEVSSHRT